MISAAHVGIGIRGVEGQQAARASDYAIGEFKLLKRLLFVHGRECCRRNANLILYNFFKNIVLVLPVFWVGFHMAFSGQRIYENWLYSLFNVFFSSWPIIIYGLFDQEYNDSSLMEYPFLYEKGARNEHFRPRRFWLWFLNALWQSGVIGSLAIYYMEYSAVTQSGKMVDIWGTGALILGVCVMIANLKILTFSFVHSLTGLFFVFGSIGVYITAFVIVNTLRSSDLYKNFKEYWSTGNFYFSHIILLAATTLMDLANERYHSIDYIFLCLIFVRSR